MSTPVRGATSSAGIAMAEAAKARASEARDHRRARQLRHGRAILWLGALAPFIYATPRTTDQVTGVTALDVLRGGGPIVCYLWILLIPRFKEFKVPRGAAEYGLFGFIGVALLSAAWTEFSPLSVLLKATQLLFMYLCVAKVAATYEDFAATLRGALNVIHLILVGTLVQYLIVPSITYSSSDPAADPVARLHSTIPAISSNILGVAIGAGLLSLLMRVGPSWVMGVFVRWPLILIYGVMLLGTRSRTITAAVALVFFVSCLYAIRRSWVALAGAFFALAAGIAAVAFLWDQQTQATVVEFFTRGQNADGLTTLTGRTVIWSEAIRYWHEHTWLGGGYYTGHRLALAYFNPLFRGYSNIDSTWIESLVDVGLIGAALLTAFALRGTWQLLRVQTDKYSRVMAISLWTAIVVVSFINPGLQSATITAILGGAMVFGSTGRLRQPGQRGRPSGARFTPGQEAEFARLRQRREANLRSRGTN